MATEKNKKKETGRVAQLRTPVLDLLSKAAGKSLNYKQIAAKLNVEDKNLRRELAQLLHRMKEDGDLAETGPGKYRVKRLERPHLVGKVDMTATGAAFVICDGVDRDVFVAPRKVRHALPGDTVKVYVYVNQRNNKLEGEIVEVVQRARELFVGTLTVNRHFAFMVPDDHRMPVDFYIAKDEMNGAVDGDKVQVRLLDWPESAHNPMGRVENVLGRPGEHQTEMQSILAGYDFPLCFPPKVEAEAEAISDTIDRAEVAQRRDMSKVPTFTIDPTDAKDFDDALSFQPLANGLFEVGVHIADVSHYVRPGTALDAEAVERATSVYMVDRVVPMLPEKLSNHVCSLRPDEDKLTYSAIFEMDMDGKVHREWFGRTVIRSQRRFTYDQAQEVIDSGKGDMATEIGAMWQMASKLRADRFRNGALVFEKDEVKFNLDAEGNPTGIYIKEYKDSNKLIEEFMLLANRQVAESIGKPRTGSPRTYVYRIHDEPSQEKLELLVEMAATFGHRVELGPRRTLARSLNKLLDDIKGRPEENLLGTMTIRSMAKAVYSTENIGHYGLGFTHYSHFTSPIRRYPDVLAHRLLTHYLEGGRSANANELEQVCQHCSDMERKASEAERTSVKYMQAKFLLSRVGDEFDGVITGVTDWGLYVEIKENRCEGMVRLRDLTDDFYDFDERTMTVTGSRTGRSYRLGDEMRVRVTAVSLEKKQVDMAPVHAEGDDIGFRPLPKWNRPLPKGKAGGSSRGHGRGKSGGKGGKGRRKG
jgi:ribonuclease R